MRMPDVTEPFDLVLFGASGDLALRKLIPALYYLHLDGRLHEEGRIWAVTRSTTNLESYLEHIKQAAHQYGTEVEPKIWQSFIRRIRHIGMDLDKASGYAKLAKKLQGANQRCVFYCAVHSRLYPEISEQLFAQNIINEHSIIVLEKPIGSDYQSGQAINRRVAEFFDESQIYRIDHYLGKETVQNLLALRFANSIFEHQWNQRYIDHVQITISETATWRTAGSSKVDDTTSPFTDLIISVTSSGRSSINKTIR